MDGKMKCFPKEVRMSKESLKRKQSSLLIIGILCGLGIVAAELLLFAGETSLYWIAEVIGAFVLCGLVYLGAEVPRIVKYAIATSVDREQFKKLFRAMPMGVAQVKKFNNGEFQLVDANTQFCKYFNIMPSDYEGITLSASSQDILRMMNAWLDAFSRNITSIYEVQTFEITLENIDKTFNTTIFYDELSHINIVFSDITEQKETELKLSQAIDEANAAYKTQGEFLANMSHEIRTPINGILGMLQLTLISKDLATEHRDNLETAKNCADTLLRLINDILDYTKLEAGKYKIRYTEMDVREVIENAVNLQKPIAENKNLELDCQLPVKTPKKLIGDPQRVEQVLNCLMSNAIKFTLKGGVRVKVAVIEESKEQVRVRIAVADSGIGISDGDREKLFKRFSQVDGSNTRKFGGSGLGLVITKQIVELMGGSIAVQSKEDIGSTFIVEIPMKVVESQEEVEEVTDVSVFSMENSNQIKILVAEDEPVNQQVIGKLLGMAGYSYDIVGNGEKAIELYKGKSYDIGLFDVQMPIMDGLEATRHIREIEKSMGKGVHMPIIAVTARAMFGEKEKILEAQLDDYVAKPYILEDIVAVINKYTSRS